jgi:hypothetical protein
MRPISHPRVWSLMRDVVREMLPRDMSRWLPAEPMRRHHYLYGRNRYLVPMREVLRDRLEAIASRQAVEELGLCDPDGPGSVTHPDASRMIYADGKVVTPLWRAKPGDTTMDRQTGEIRALRAEADAALHVTGSGEPAWGTKHVMVATRSDDVHGRMILSVAPVEKPGDEAKIAMTAIGRLAPLLPGALGVIYDGAFRGVHLAELLHRYGLLPIVPVQAATGGRRARKPRTERTVLVASGLYTQGGALCSGELDERGNIVLTPLERTKTEKRANADGTWRWYGVYAGGVRVRLDTTDEDRARRFNRSEHLRPIPPGDPDYRRLYPLRSDAESINRALDDSSWLGRAHSVGRARQLVNLLGYALAVNSLALHRHRRRLALAA